MYRSTIKEKRLISDSVDLSLSTMDQKHFILLMLKFGYGFCMCFGLCPFWFNFQRKSFETAWYHLVYPILVYCSFSYFYPTSGLTVISLLNPLVVVAFFYMTMVNISVIFLVQSMNANHIVNYLNELMEFEHRLNIIYKKSYGNQYLRPILLFLCKTVLVSCFAQVAVINCCVILAKMLTGQTDYFVIFIISVAYFLQTIVPNMFYTLVLVATFHYKQINREIENMVNEIQNIAASDAMYTMQERRTMFFNLSERLDLIANCHGTLTARIIEANDIFSKQLLVSSANFVGILILEVIGGIALCNYAYVFDDYIYAFIECSYFFHIYSSLNLINLEIQSMICWWWVFYFIVVRFLWKFIYWVSSVRALVTR